MSGERAVRPLALAVGVAVPVALVAAALSGATAPLVLGDAGPLVRWGLPTLRAVHDVAAAATVGLLLLAAFVVPEARTSSRRATAARAAVGSGVVWALTALVGTVLTYADSAGVGLSAPGFWASFTGLVWSLETTRLPLLETALVVATTTVAALARSREGLAWAFAGSVAALVPLSYGGHASGSVGHEQAMTALLIHLVGVCLWLGGLIGLLLLRPGLGSALDVSVRRFSTVALVSAVAVGGSGVLFAVVQLPDLASLTGTPYGLLLLAKTAALVVLIGFGARHRAALVRGGLERPGAFARLALVEVGVMAAAFGLAVALSRTAPPASLTAPPDDRALDLTGYPLPEPYDAGVWLRAWEPFWLFLIAAAVAVGLYVAAAVRLHRRGDRWPVAKVVLWVIGWALFVYATSGAPGVYGRLMFSVHMVMHMTLMMAVPIFLVLAAPVTLALRALPARRDRTLGPREVLLALVHSRVARLTGNPVVAAVLFFASLVVFYWTDLFELALRTHTGHVLMVVHFVLVGYLFVWSLIGPDPGPPKWTPPLRLLVLFATLAGHAFFALAMMNGSWLLAAGFFKELAVPWVPDLLADQQLGGSIAWGVGELPTVALALLVAVDWYRADTREATRLDRQADRDDDAALAAYNERLGQLSRPGAGGQR